MSGVFYNISGVDPNIDAKIVFVWCRVTGSEEYSLLGSGHLVGENQLSRPPGILSGQYSVTFLLPPGCSPDDVFVTDDKSGSEHLSAVTLTPCIGIPGPASGRPVISGSVN